MVRLPHRSLLVALSLAAGLAGCAPGQVIDKLPGDLGLPAGTPERPTTPYVYPAVHDMPPPRVETPMTEEQQVTLEKELKALRDQREAQDKAAALPEEQRIARENELKATRDQQEAAVKEKKAAAAKKSSAAGAQDGAKTNP
ncbi:MAG TPA: hypothetical protein VGF53_01625 [Pseudolabrys sp.]|jgi:hypothetical protein